MGKRFFAALLIACVVLVSTMTVRSVAQRGRGPSKGTTQVKKPPVPGDVAPTRSQELWVNIFPVGMQIFGLHRDVRHPNTIYARTHRGLYKTSNGGMYWAPLFVRGTQFLTFAQSPSSPNVMYLGTSDTDTLDTDIFMPVPFGRGMENGSLWRSDNDGRTWQDINAGNIIKGGIRQVAVDPRDPNVVYTVSGELFKSSNGGRTWATIGPGGRADHLSVNPSRPDNLILLGSQSLQESPDGGLTWNDKKSHAQFSIQFTPQEREWQPDSNSRATIDGDFSSSFVMFHPTNRAIRLLGGVEVHAEGGLVYSPLLAISQDDGRSWEDISIREKPYNNRAQITCLEFSLQSDQVIYAGTESGWYVSKNRGSTWQKLRSYEPVPYGNLYSPWLTQRSDQPVDIATGAANELYIATGLGIFKSPDGGSSWHQASLGLPTPTVVKEFLWREPLLVTLLEFIDDPSNTIYVGPYGSYWRSGYWTSKDGGLSWNQHSVQSVQVEAGVPPPVLQILVALDRTVYLRLPSDVIKVAPDGSASFLKSGLWRGPDLVSLPLSDSSKLYLTAIRSMNASELYMSDDGGFSWRIVDLSRWFTQSLAGDNATSIPIISVSHQSFDTAYLVGDVTPQLLLATRDGGKTWRNVFPSLELSMRRAQPFGELSRITSVVVDPKDSRVVYVMTDQRVFRSEDGGMTWSRLPTGLLQTPFKGLAVSPSAPNELYLASDHVVFRSTDSGKTWSFSDRGFAGDSIRGLMVSSSLVLAQGNNGIYRMSDDRLSWAVDGWQRMEKGENSIRESAALARPSESRPVQPPTPEAYEPVRPDTAKEVTINVRGTSRGTDTNINVQAGDQLTITASGTVIAGRRAGEVGPEGGRTGGFGAIIGNRPVPTAGPGALIGYIRLANGQITQPFLIGNELILSVPSDGRLFLAINDDDYSDNGGSFSVRIRY